MRNMAYFLLFIGILLLPEFVVANGIYLQKAPQHAFSKFPLKGLVNSSMIVSKDPFSRARYRVNSEFQLICKARLVVTNYPPRYTGDNNNSGTLTSSSIFKTNVVFDAMELTTPLKNSNHYVSSDVVCGSYERYYYLWLYQSYITGSGTILELWGIAQLRWFSRQPYYSDYYKTKWCRALTVGISGNLEYFKAIFKLDDRRIYYYSGMYPQCTRSWNEVQQWQRQGWYLIQ